MACTQNKGCQQDWFVEGGAKKQDNNRNYWAWIIVKMRMAMVAWIGSQLRLTHDDINVWCTMQKPFEETANRSVVWLEPISLSVVLPLASFSFVGPRLVHQYPRLLLLLLCIIMPVRTFVAPISTKGDQKVPIFTHRVQRHHLAQLETIRLQNCN